MTPSGTGCIGVERFARLFLISPGEYHLRYLVAISLKFISRHIDKPHSGYFDESYKEDTIAVAGWVGTYEGWNRLEYEWRKALPASANGDFHYTDFWHSPKNYAAHWSHEKRLDHIRKLARIACDCAAFAVGVAFSMKAFNEAIPAHKREILTPLNFCFANCISLLVAARAARNVLPPTPWDIMFDQKAEERNGIGQVFLGSKALFDKEGMLGNVGFGDRKHMAPLQAADLLVGEIRRNHAGLPSEIFEMLKEQRPIM